MCRNGKRLLQREGAYLLGYARAVNSEVQDSADAEAALSAAGGRIVDIVHAGRRGVPADAAQWCQVHPATLSRLLAVHRQRAVQAKPPCGRSIPWPSAQNAAVLSALGRTASPCWPRQERTR